MTMDHRFGGILNDERYCVLISMPRFCTYTG